MAEDWIRTICNAIFHFLDKDGTVVATRSKSGSTMFSDDGYNGTLKCISVDFPVEVFAQKGIPISDTDILVQVDCDLELEAAIVHDALCSAFDKSAVRIKDLRARDKVSSTLVSNVKTSLRKALAIMSCKQEPTPSISPFLSDTLVAADDTILSIDREIMTAFAEAEIFLSKTENDYDYFCDLQLSLADFYLDLRKMADDSPYRAPTLLYIVRFKERLAELNYLDPTTKFKLKEPSSPRLILATPLITPPTSPKYSAPQRDDASGLCFEPILDESVKDAPANCKAIDKKCLNSSNTANFEVTRIIYIEMWNMDLWKTKVY